MDLKMSKVNFKGAICSIFSPLDIVVLNQQTGSLHVIGRRIQRARDVSFYSRCHDAALVFP